MKIKYIAIEGKAENKEEAIKLCGKALVAEGAVGKSFIENCIIRELEYPTGLPTDIPVAIPHCKDDSVIENSVCFLKLEKPVIFYRMDDDQEYIETDMIFNLAINGAGEHVDTLGNLMRFIGDSESIEVCYNLDIKDVPKYLEEKLG